MHWTVCFKAHLKILSSFTAHKNLSLQNLQEHEALKLHFIVPAWK